MNKEKKEAIERYCERVFFWVAGSLVMYLVLLPQLNVPEPLVVEVPASAPVLQPDPCELKDVVCEEEKPRVEQLESLIRSMARVAGYPEERAVSMAWCESSMNEFAANPVSSAKGLFQFTDGTWREINASGHQYDAEENIKQFLIWDQVHPEWWECE